ncbi:MAG: tRNA pseudouridine(13) synthase TruD [Methylococcales bacterium]|nr:tRNA pseudouridine(13) synthase TruD [Methylococcales bacterium]
MTELLTLPQWSYAYGSPASTGVIKTQPDDFIVEEQLPFEADGTGEHVFVQIQKQGENTDYVARVLARVAKVRQRDIGVAGLKDRHGLTTQWFSVWLPGKATPDWSEVETETIKVLQSTRHTRKLKRGVLTGNQFQLLIRDFSGDREACQRQLNQIKMLGFPNYFGSQRFGLQGKNIDTVLALFAGTRKIKRPQRGIYLSAARSYLFNQILSHRVENNSWDSALEDDILMFADSNSYFKVTALDDELKQRISQGILHPTGCLYGKGEVLANEMNLLTPYDALTTGLVKFDLESDRRVLRVIPQNLQWQFLTPEQLQLRFFLPAGGYATALLREIINF